MRKLYEMPDTVVLIQTHKEYDEYNQMRLDAGFNPLFHTFNEMLRDRRQYNLINNLSITRITPLDYKVLTLSQLKEILSMWKEGDVICRREDKILILGICGKALIPSQINNFSAASIPSTQKEFEIANWKLYEEPKQVEVTLEEIAKMKGIPVEQLRIKEKE